MWDRIRSLFARPPAKHVTPSRPPTYDYAMDPGRTSIGSMPAMRGADALLTRIADDATSQDALPEILVAIDALREEGRAAHALRLGRRILAARPHERALALKLAHLAADRGDDDIADEILTTLVDGDDASVDALMLYAEIRERKEDRGGALRAYERVLSRSIDFPRAKERAARLREDSTENKRVDMTLLADGALTRGRYRLTRECGRGGAGTVFLADDLRTSRACALKIYHGRGRVERERLSREASIAAQLDHAGVVRIFDVDEELMAIAMEWLPRGSLKELMKHEALPLSRVRAILNSLTDALAFVHEEGYVHRDIKPSNVLLRDDDTAVLTDFGLARRIGEAPALATGEIGEGTLAYMAPEQRMNAPAAPSADIHALGATIRELLAPVPGPLPAAVLDVATACLRLDPAERPTLAMIRDALK